MGKRIREKQSAMPHGNDTHPGRVWGILHVIKYHHWRHVKRRLTHKKHGGGERNDASHRDGIPENVDDSVHDMSVHYEPNTTLSNAEENLEYSTLPAKSSIKSRLKAFIQDEMTRKKCRHKRSSTCPTKSQLTRADSIHHLEVDPLTELLLTGESPEPVLETFQNHHASGTFEASSPVFSNKAVTNNEKCVDCGTMFSSDILEQNMDHKHHKQCTDTSNLASPNESDPEEKLINAKILTNDVSPHLFKDFLDALDIINTNKDYLLNYIQDPGSPLPFNSHNELKFSGKRRSNSISFPVFTALSGTKDSESDQLINQMVDECFDEKGENKKSSMFDFIEDYRPLSRPSPAASSSVSSQVPSHVKTNHFKDLRMKIKQLIDENKNEKLRITMDAVIDKIPRGSSVSKNVKKLIHDKFKDNGEGKDSAGSGFERSLSFNSFKKRQQSMRTSSLKESARRYSQLYETCFNTDIKYPKPEKLKLKAEEKTSILKTPKSFKRFLSLPNLKSYFHQIEEPSISSSPQCSTTQFGEKIRSTSFKDEKRSFDHGDDLKSHILPLTFADNTIPESILNADQKNLLVRSASKSGLDVINEGKDDTNITIDVLENFRDSDIAAMPIDANPIFSSDTSFLDATFEFDKLNLMEDSELQPGPADEVDEQQEPEVYETEMVESVDNFHKIGTLSKGFNYEIPCIEVKESHKATFNYVRKVLELSGFTGHESFGIWYSDNQPVDPSIYEELEGCLLLDPDCSGNCDEDGQCNHLLLFDIINEGLLEIFGRSYSYYPRPLSYLSHVHPLPSGDNVLHKVWNLISWYLNSPSPQVYPSLDYYVSIDLAKNDGWMNLQFDSECVGLELDDLIFDDLLDEIIFTSA
ncbi:hypothetical protein TanjilG_19514 [Lupinus angustifolius]|uniref:DUF4378 domain-containing protein n=1 Tax=Lupinus angustifolius TaxID=3871 RepID=A0A1J7HWS9_LUPAN|nr:PREDICTED: uncharacterized protein LOC109353672 [Lupinus angustifolius]OIW06865.1 hypothetical protein TanjilG_19514 [Lupinus angustifolius]